MHSSPSHLDYASMITTVRESLPTLPLVMEDLSEKLKDPNASTHSVQEMMTSDPSLTMKILRIANSVQFRGSRGRVTDVGEAIATLGFDKIQMAIITTSVFKVYDLKDSEIRFDPKELWKHSLGVAVASSTIAEVTGGCIPQRAYTCGLIHDIGKIARLKLDADSFCDDVGQALYDEIPLHEAEASAGSPLHDRLGHFVCKEWGMSREVDSVIRWHHEPELSERNEVGTDDLHRLIDIVTLGNWLAHSMQFGFSGHRAHGKPPEQILERLGLDSERLPELKNATRSSFKDFNTFIKVLERIERS